MNELGKLQEWVADQCDGEWEHGDGIVISTLDNPGWAIDLETDGLSTSDPKLEAVRVERNDQDWLHCFQDGTKIKVRCGLHNLTEAMQVLLKQLGVDV